MLAVLSCASFAVATQGTPSQASLLQPASVTVAVTGGAPYVATPTTVAFTVTNHATNGAGLSAFTLVVPRGIGTVTPVGVTGPGNWREVVVPCSTREGSADVAELVEVGTTLALKIVSAGVALLPGECGQLDQHDAAVDLSLLLAGRERLGQRLAGLVQPAEPGQGCRALAVQ